MAETAAMGRPPAIDPEDTLVLLKRAQQGDETARDTLFERCLPRLRRWARGRLPGFARGLMETDDLVQETVLHTLHRLTAFEPRHEGALQAYLRQAVLNRIRDEIRRASSRPAPLELSDGHADDSVSPLDQAIGRQAVDRDEIALQKLRPQDREAVIARIELQYSYDELAVVLDRPTANAARVAVTRAVARLVRVMASSV